MKKTISVICLLLLAALILPACEQNVPEEMKEYDAVISSSGFNYSNQVTFTWMPKMFFEGDNTVYNYDIAEFAFLAVLDAHDNALVKLADTADTNETDNTALLSGLGFQNIREYPVVSTDGVDKCDTSRMLVGTYSDNGNAIINVSFIGTANSEEWASNLDIGSTASEYEAQTGAHPDWNNKSNHKGYDVAVTRAVRLFENYCKDAVPSDANNIYLLVNGYSRGAAIANIFGAMAEKGQINICDKSYKSNAYTFATPFSTDAADAAQYKTVFNLVNSDDIVPMLPPANVGMKRYGTDIIKGLKNTQLADKYYADTKQTYCASGYDVNTVITALNGICNPRAEFYTVDESANATITKKYASEAEATAGKQQLTEKFTELGILAFCKISDVYQDNGFYVFKYGFSNAFAAKLIFSMLPTGDSDGTSDNSKMLEYAAYVYCPKYSSGLLSLTSVDGGSIGNAHYPQAYFYLLEETKR